MQWGPPHWAGPKVIIKELFDERGILVGGIRLSPRPYTHYLVDARGKRILQFVSGKQNDDLLEQVYLCRRYPSKQLPKDVTEKKMEKYGVSREDVEKMVNTGEANDEQEALEKVAAGKKPKKKGKEDATGSEQAPSERK